mmetsp:Transcript_5110/g.13692  ORF Transcript_5110/g.13692 Transcript_5110/m.13692 type:complete len:239 (-) Transcript_5110:48-764(-)|eukprot:CAMPEP_0198134580 /NCGR_PEP_ID=MMETSP1442-20131203/60148_1 /TAXON_ID= /ORGANISM="Craspedostauros australis, Strain CCMP3328" /LENGTH=238 /DNA_ID=CAMNT_0043795725 /DNA_START=860 /DNA_END=1576 /DNA_ORIENTATION=+
MSGSTAEDTPLLASAETKAHPYYFLEHNSRTQASGWDGDGGKVVEEIPQGSTADEFAPRVLKARGAQTVNGKSAAAPSYQSNEPSSKPKAALGAAGSFWNSIFGSKKHNGAPLATGNGRKLIKQRKAPVKVEPKVFFANERTFLAWLHISIILAGGSIAILAFSDENNPASQLYGIVLLPVAVAFIVYAMRQYSRRAFMIRNKHPGPYEDTLGPTVLSIMLMLSIVAQFAIKLYSIRN